MEKRSVKVRKILIDAVRFWYLLILFAILGVLAGWRLTVSYNKSVDEQIKKIEDEKIQKEEAEAELAKDITETLTFTKDECEKKLDENGKSEVLEAYYWYNDKEKRREYLESSAYLKMDPYHFTGLYLEFRVKHSETEFNETLYNSYIHELKVYVNYYDLVEDLVEKNKLDTNVQELSEMIILNDGGKNSYDDFLMITIYQSPITENLENAVTDAFIGYSRKLSEIYPDYSVELAGTSKATYVNSGLASSIDSQRAAIISDQSRVEAAQKKFSSMQTAYYNMLVNGTDTESVKVVIAEGVVKKRTAVVEEEEELPSKRGIRTMALIGCAAGVILALALILLANLLSGRLLSEADFTSVLGVRSLGVILERKKKGIFGFLQRAEYPDAESTEELPYLTLDIKQLLGKQDLKEALLVSSGSLSDVTGIDTVSENAGKDGISLTRIERFPEKIEDAEKLIESSGVIIVERMHSARLKNIERILQFCREHDIPIHGAVGVAK